jgi:hypothetical protein
MKNALFVLSACLVIMCPGRVATATILSPVQSATITDENGDGLPDVVGLGFGHPGDPNYGTTLVQKGGGQFPYERRSIEEFSLLGLSTVQSATLTFSFYNSNGASSTTFETFLTAGDGQVQLSDFSASATSLGSRTVPANQSYFISYDVTNALNSILSGGASFAGVRQEIVGASGGSEVFSPQLEVIAVPEPSSTLLYFGGFSIMYALRRRNRTA